MLNLVSLSLEEEGDGQGMSRGVCRSLGVGMGSVRVGGRVGFVRGPRFVGDWIWPVVSVSWRSRFIIRG